MRCFRMFSRRCFSLRTFFSLAATAVWVILLFKLILNSPSSSENAKGGISSHNQILLEKDVDGLVLNEPQNDADFDKSNFGLDDSNESNKIGEQTKERKENEDADSDDGFLRVKAKILHIDRTRKTIENVVRVFEKLGYTIVRNNDQIWDVSWSKYFFNSSLPPYIPKQLHPHQKINFIPGLDLITNKDKLVLSGFPLVPKSFKLPDQKKKLLQYAKSRPESIWLSKNHKRHKGRGVDLLPNDDLDEVESGTIQELLPNPLLIKGRMFTAGLYVFVTSVDPLRVYINDEHLFNKYNPIELYPIDLSQRRKFIVDGDDWDPIWKIDNDLNKTYTSEMQNEKELFKYFLRKNGYDPDLFQAKMEEVVRKTFTFHERDIVPRFRRMSGFGQNENFFQLVRFDLVVDNNLDFYVLEVQHGPGLQRTEPWRSKPMQQMILSFLSLLGIANNQQIDKSLLVPERFLMTSIETCANSSCKYSCSKECSLCYRCMSTSQLESLRTAYMEHMNKKWWKRVVPRSFKSQNEAKKWIPDKDSEFTKLTDNGQWMGKWFWQKCLEDSTWC